MNYHIRLTQPYSILEVFFRHLQCESLVVYQHNADDEVKRTHVHALVKGSTVQATTMKARLTKLCGVWKKEDWAFTTSYVSGEERLPVDDKLITYMSKGILEPSLVVGFTDEFIEIMRSQWVAPKVKKATKSTYDDLVKEVLTLTPFGTASEFEIINNVIAVCNKHNVVCGRYKIRDIYDTVLRRQNPLAFSSRIHDMCVFPIKKSYEV